MILYSIESKSRHVQHWSHHENIWFTTNNDDKIYGKDDSKRVNVSEDYGKIVKANSMTSIEKQTQGSLNN